MNRTPPLDRSHFRPPHAARCLLLAGLAGAFAAGCSEPGPSPPNTILIIVDTLRADAILDPGNKIATPNIDALAQDGILFPHAFSHAPMTLPSHTALFASREPHKSGVVNNYKPVPQDLPLFPEWMGQHGYSTSAAVSMGSLWAPERGTMVDRGFDTFMRSLPWLRPADDMELDFNHLVPKLAEGGPFFLFAHYGDPHVPLNSHGVDARVAQLTVTGSEAIEVTLSEASFVRRSFDVPPGGAEVAFESADTMKLMMLSCNQLGSEFPLELQPIESLEGGGYRLAGALGEPRPKTRSAWFEAVLSFAAEGQPAPVLTIAGNPVGGAWEGTHFRVGEQIDITSESDSIEIHSEAPFEVISLGLRAWSTNREIEIAAGELYEPVQALRGRIPNPTDATIQAVVRCWISDTPSQDEVLARYMREVEYVDGYVGRLLDRLKELGLYDDSLILFTSDHGEGLGQHDWIGHVNNVYDELIHVPLIIKPPVGHPDAAALGERSGWITRHVDLGPTILRIAGLPPLPGQLGEPIVEGGSRVHFAETRKPEAPVDMLCLRDDQYKLLYIRDEQRFELYDMQADPNELNDLYGQGANPRAVWEAQLEAMADAYDGDPGEKESIDRLKALGY